MSVSASVSAVSKSCMSVYASVSVISKSFMSASVSAISKIVMSVSANSLLGDMFSWEGQLEISNWKLCLSCKEPSEVGKN